MLFYNLTYLHGACKKKQGKNAFFFTGSWIFFTPWGKKACFLPQREGVFDYGV